MKMSERKEIELLEKCNESWRTINSQLMDENYELKKQLAEVRDLILEIAKQLGTNECDGWNGVEVLGDIETLKKQLLEVREINTNLMAQAEIEHLKEANHCLEFERDYQIVDLKAVMWHLKLDYKDLIRARRKYAEHNKEIAESTKIN
jgi:hypothetical protein